MYASVILAALAGSAIAAPVVQRSKPVGWATGYLESYETYHARYIALNCHDQHDTEFFDDCCHPLLSTESLDSDRKAYCTPNATASSSAVMYNATATVTDSADADAATEWATATASLESVYSSATAAEATSTESSSSAEATSSIDNEVKYAPKPKTTSTSEWVEPSTTHHKAPAKTSEASSGGSSGGQVMSGGFATFFYQNGNAGECGTVHSDNDKVIAIDSNGWWPDYASNDNSPHCGKWITITNTNNGKSTTAMVADVCPTCTTDNSLDLSVGAFTAIASESDGMVPITWTWA